MSLQIHRIVRYTQLMLSLVILISSSLLLHYRISNHSNFTEEPLVSCISGAVAFIYAFWTIINHKRNLDGNNWEWLHGIICLAIAGFLLAASILAFKNHNKMFFCSDFQNRDKGVLSILNKREDRQYAPGEMCENNYNDLDRACAILGVIATFMWLVDFSIIVGFLSPVEELLESPDRSQVEPEAMEDYYNERHVTRWNVNQYPNNGYTVSEHKGGRPVSPLESNNHAQEPISSVQHTNYQRSGPLGYEDKSYIEKYIHTNGAPQYIPINIDDPYLQHKFPTTPPVASLGLPSHPRTKWRYIPDTQHVSHLTRQKSNYSTSTYIGDHSPLQSPSDRDIASLSFTGSPQNPSCYAFDPSQQTYMPTFVNIAARAGQKQGLQVMGAPIKRSSLENGYLSQPLQLQVQTVNDGGTIEESPQLNSLSLFPLNFRGSSSYFPAAKTAKDLLEMRSGDSQMDGNQSPSQPGQKIQYSTETTCSYSGNDVSNITVVASSNADGKKSVENQPQFASPISIYRGDF